MRVKAIEFRIHSQILTIIVALAATVLFGECSIRWQSTNFALPSVESARRVSWTTKKHSKKRDQWFVAPGGRPGGQGTLKSPWNLATALDVRATRGRIKSGDTIWLRGGIYIGNFTATIAGTVTEPIQVRGYENERAIIDKNSAERKTGALNVRGSNVWFRDFEVTNSFPDRSRLDANGELNPWRGSGINIYAPNTKYINLVIRDSGHAFGLWNEDGGTEIYGCVMFNNGNNKMEHGIYGHNKSGKQLIADNIIFNGAGYGLHIYANSTKSSINGFDIEGNAVFNNGALTLDDQSADQILVGGVRGVSAERITLRDNYIYNEPNATTAKNRGIRLGYEDAENKDVRLFGNYIVSKIALKILWWNLVEARGNTIYSRGTIVEIKTPASKRTSDYLFEANNYLSAGLKDSVFILNGERKGFADWRQQNDLDRNSRIERSTDVIRLSANKVFVRPNKYENGRANIIVYNWSGSPSVRVNLTSVLRAGEKYEVRDAQNYTGEAAATGVYDGKAILLPLNLSKTSKPVGNVERVPLHTGLEFGVYVVRRKQKTDD